MNEAKTIRAAAHGSTATAMELAAAQHTTVDQDWNTETTRFCFADGSVLTISGPCVKAA